MKTGWKILSGLKFRYLLASFIVMTAILIAAGYYSIKAGQEATLDSLTEQGKALTTVLTASASNIIETDRQLKDISVDNILAEIDNITQSRTREIDIRFLRMLSGRMRLTRMYYLDDTLGVIDQHDSEQRSFTVELDSLYKEFIQGVELDSTFDVVFDIYSAGERWFLYALIPFEKDTYLVIVKNWQVGQFGNPRLSLAYLLNQLSQEAGIEYIMLQNVEGIVFASKLISQMARIEDDDFLVEALDSDTALSRVIDFQDREILEVVQKFDSGEEFNGLFRVGLSLYAHRQLTSNLRKQIWLFTILLFIIGFVGVVIVVGYQNLTITEDALSRATAITQSLQDSIAGIVISTDENLNIITANIAARQHFGLPEIDSGNRRYDDYFPDDPFRVKAVFKEKRPRNFETQIKGSSGMMHLLVSTSTLYSGQKKATGVIVVAHDISEKQALEKQAQQSHRLSELGTVAAGLAHDIRNPLNAIGMVIQRMKNEIEVASDSDEFDNFLNTLKTEHIKLNAIIEKILQVARSSRLELKPVMIKAVIDEAIALYRYEANENDIEIKAAVEDGEIKINELGFKSIISNLIKNAIEAIGKNGTIEIISSFSEDKLRVKIIDNGHGIPADKLDNLFKPFYTTKQGGTGLGLATAYKAAVDHGGDIKVESQIGGPTVFTVIIPVKR